MGKVRRQLRVYQNVFIKIVYLPLKILFCSFLRTISLAQKIYSTLILNMIRKSCLMRDYSLLVFPSLPSFPLPSPFSALWSSPTPSALPFYPIFFLLLISLSFPFFLFLFSFPIPSNLILSCS